MRGGHGHGHRCRPSEPDPVDRLRDPDSGTAAAPELPRRHLPHPGRVARPRHHPLTRRGRRRANLAVAQAAAAVAVGHLRFVGAVLDRDLRDAVVAGAAQGHLALAGHQRAALLAAHRPADRVARRALLLHRTVLLLRDDALGVLYVPVALGRRHRRHRHPGHLHARSDLPQARLHRLGGGDGGGEERRRESGQRARPHERRHDGLFGSSEGSSGARGSALSSIPLASRPQRVTSVTRSSVALRRWLNSRTRALKKARPAGGFWPTTAVMVSRSSTSSSVSASACTVAERWSPPNRFISPKNSPGPMRVRTLSTLWATALEMTSWPESTKYISSPTSPSRNSAWPACTARQVIRDASVSISGPLNARKISSVRRMAMVAGAAPPARGLAGPPAGTTAKPRAARSAATARERRSPAGRRTPSLSRRSMTTRTPSSHVHCRHSDSKTSGRARATTSSTESIARYYRSRSPPRVTTSRNLATSALICSTSTGRKPPAAKWPVTDSGLIVTVRTSRMWRAASSGSHSGFNRSFTPVMMSVLALIARSAFA